MPNLVVQTAYLGDLLLAIPLLRAVKARFPSQPLWLVCRKGYGSLLVELGVCDRAFEIPRGDGAAKKRVFQELSSQEFDFVFSPHRSVRTAMLLRHLRAQKKIGFYHWWNFFAFDQRVPFETRWPDALRQLSLLRVFSDFKWDNFEAFASPLTKATTEDFLKQPIPEALSMTLPQLAQMRNLKSRRILIAPGSVWPTKRWNTKGYIEVAKSLLQQGFEVVLIGSPEERDLCTEIAQAAGAQNQAGAHSLLQLLEFMATSRALITNDSGAMHLAAVAGLPLASIFGPTTLAQGYRPWQSRALVVQKDLDCRPCGRHGGKKCPLGHHHCMVHVEAADVLSAIHSFI